MSLSAASLIPATAMKTRLANERGAADFGWLKARHSFSFGEYHDPRFMGFGPLRVINEDHIAPGKGFPMHPHRHMEIFTYVLKGAIAHEDDFGNRGEVKAGGVQYMSAGKGVRHSEFNPSPDNPLHLLQIWLLPTQEGTAPDYDSRVLPDADRDGRLHLFLSPDGRGDSIPWLANADAYSAKLSGDQMIEFELSPSSDKAQGYIQMARGEMEVNGVTLNQGDGLAIERFQDKWAPVIRPETRQNKNAKQSGGLCFSHGKSAEFILFDFSG